MIARRSLLRSALAAPFIAKLDIIMPVRSIAPDIGLEDIVRGIDPWYVPFPVSWGRVYGSMLASMTVPTEYRHG